MKFTFKKFEKETGLRAVGAASGCYIKLNKKEVGKMSNNGAWGDGKFRVDFTVKDENTECGWRWIRLKATFDSEERARQFLNENIDALLSRYTFHYFED